MRRRSMREGIIERPGMPLSVWFQFDFETLLTSQPSAWFFNHSSRHLIRNYLIQQLTSFPD